MKTQTKFAMYGFVGGILIGAVTSQVIFKSLILYKQILSLSDSNINIIEQSYRLQQFYINPSFYLTIIFGIVGMVVGFYIGKKKGKRANI